VERKPRTPAVFSELRQRQRQRQGGAPYCAGMTAAFCWYAPLPLPRSAPRVRTGAGAAVCGRANARVTRRAALAGLAAAAAVPLFGARAAEPPPQLPDGARQFNNLRAAQKQWVEVGGVLRREGPVSAEEWANLSGYLRVFFRVGEDIEFLSKGWEVERRERVKEIVKEMRREVKEMDKVVGEGTRAKFLEKHGVVEGLLVEFTRILEDDRGDVPADL
jgi:hypothetical protein